MITRRVRFVREGHVEGGVRLRLEPGAPGIDTADARRLARAAEWAVALDAQYRALIQAGQRPQVVVPTDPDGGAGRVTRHTLAEYRQLRFGVGALIRPLFRPRLDPPALRTLYAFQRRGVRWLIDPTRRNATSPDVAADPRSRSVHLMRPIQWPGAISAADNDRAAPPPRTPHAGTITQDGVILADDMGLGKTVQVISAMRLLFRRGDVRTALIVCPKSLISNWERELARWAPELGVAVLTPPTRIRDAAWEIVAGHRHVLLTNYEQFRQPPACLLREAPDLVIADEAHRIRNRGARTTSGIHRVTPRRFWALTGTPIERDLKDLATLLSVVAPGRFTPEDAERHPSSLRSRARGCVLRRRKQHVLHDLPPVLDTTDVLELTAAQARAYRAAVTEHRRHGGPGEALALVSRLQTLCDLERESGESGKIERILHLLGRIRDRGERAVIFSHRIEPLRVLHARIADRWARADAVLLIGTMDRDERDRAVETFRRSGLALLASLQVGGEGLTLVEANHVFLFNQWWNPSTNNQALARVVRIGQHRKVRLYRFCCRGTIEEALERILTAKRALFEDVVERLAQGDNDAWQRLMRRVVREEGLDRLLDQEPAG